MQSKQDHKLVSSAPDPRENEEACFQFAHQLQVAGKLQDSCAVYRHLLAFNPGHVLALYNLGVACEALGDDRLAFNHYQAASKLDPGYARAQNNIGALLAKQGRHEEAVAIFRQAVSNDKDYGQAWANLCHSLKQIGRKSDAIDAGRNAIKLVPDSFRAQNNLGVILLDTADYKEAQSCFENALRIEPDSRLALNNLATSLEKQYRYPEALPYFEKAVTKHPDYVRAHINFAWTRLSLDQWDESVALSLKALELLAGDEEPIELDEARPKRRVLNDDISREAMEKFLAACDDHKVDCFLAFGTLLGCERDSALIAYDTDIDLGYFEDQDLLPVLEALPADDFQVKLKPAPGGKTDLASVLHDTINITVVYKKRVHLDLYRHWRSAGKTYSGFELGSAQLLYEVSDFKLNSTQFLGLGCLVPDEARLYLEECYGDWETPNACFETTLHSPNLVDVFPPHARAVAYYRTAQRFFDKNYVKGFALLEKLQEREGRPDSLQLLRDRFQARILEPE